MAEFPALPLWTDAYLADTRHLTTVEHGAYLLLLMTAWRTPDVRLPDDDKMLARWAGLDARRWAQIKPNVMAMWSLENGVWTQKRLSKEAVWVRKNAEANRNRASLGGKAKALKNNSADVLEAQSKHASSLLPTPTPTPNREANASLDNAQMPKADGFDAFWKAYPRRVGKEAARKAWAACLKRGAKPWHVIEGAEWLAAHPPDDPQFIPHPSTWLNQGRYDDERIEDGNQPVGRDRSAPVRQYRRDAAWEGLQRLRSELDFD